MTPRLPARFAVIGLSGLAAACASTAPGPMTSGFSASGGVAAAPSAVRAEPPGYQINGAAFSGDLIFEARGDRPVVIYRHAVDGAPMLIAELDLEAAWLSDGVQRFEGVSDRGVDLEVALVSGPCLEGGRLHARFARVQAGRTVYEGCARETGPVISWSERLPRYLDAVQACEAEAAGSSMAFVRRGGGHVIHARTEEGADILRYRFGERGRWDCAVSGERVRWSVVPERAAALPGEGDPVFAPGRMPAPGDGCYLYERVQTADGVLIGALGQDVCSGGMAGDPGETPFG
jgi:hypothetical protein